MSDPETPDEGLWREPEASVVEKASEPVISRDEEVGKETKGGKKENANLPLADSTVLDEIKEAERRAKMTASSIAKMRESIQKLTEKDDLTPEEVDELQKKQAKIVAKLSEFEMITKRIQYLVGLADSDPSRVALESGVVKEMTNPDHLPKVIIPPGMSAQVPKIIVCEPMKKSGQTPLYQQFSGRQPDPCKPCDQQETDAANFGPQMQPNYGAPMQPNYGPPMQPNYGQPMQPNYGPSMQPNYGLQIPNYNPQLQAMLPPQLLAPSWTPGQTTDAVNQPYGPCYAPSSSQIPATQFMPNPEGIVEHLSERLDASYKLQEKLVQENSNMEGERYELQEEIISREQNVETLQKKLTNLENEMKLKALENKELKEQLERCGAKGGTSGGVAGGNLYPSEPLCKKSLGQDTICKLDLYKQMGLPIPLEGTGMYSVPGQGQDPTDVETLVGCMEEEVRCMQKELALVQAERRSLELQRKLLNCANPKSGVPVQFPTSPQGAARLGPTEADREPEGEAPMKSVAAPTAPPSAPPTSPPRRPQPVCVKELQAQLSEARQQYVRLQEDFSAKVSEISTLRVEMESVKKQSVEADDKVKAADARVDDLLERLKAVENEKSRINGSKDQLIELEQQMILAKQRFVEGQEEVEEMKSLIQDQTSQLEDYRNKYLNAQEVVEDQRRQIDEMETNNLRFSEQLNKELQVVKMEFQRRLEELSPLPDLLKATQMKLQESTQLRLIAERACEELTNELLDFKEKQSQATRRLEESQQSLENGELSEETKAEMLKLKATISRLEEMATDKDRKLEERSQEVIQLHSQLETLREESARQVSRTKDRSESMKKNLQGQIADLEVQLAQSRAQARAANKDRDEIRQKMECQITNLTRNFEQAQGWVRCLQSHVSFLKTSNKNVILQGQEPNCIPKALDPRALLEP